MVTASALCGQIGGVTAAGTACRNPQNRSRGFCGRCAGRGAPPSTGLSSDLRNQAILSEDSLVSTIKPSSLRAPEKRDAALIRRASTSRQNEAELKAALVVDIAAELQRTFEAREWAAENYPEVPVDTTIVATTDRMLHGWATDANKTPAGRALQEAVSRRTGIAADWLGELDEEGAASFLSKEAHLLKARHGVDLDPYDDLDDAAHLDAFADAFADVVYRRTQAQLAEQGITELVVFRGIHPLRPDDDDLDLYDDWENDEPGSFDHPHLDEILYGSTRAGRIENPPLQPLSSWSTSRDVARSFAEDGSPDGGVVMTAVIPASAVFSLPHTGVGCLHEDEAVLIGGSGAVYAERTARGRPSRSVPEWLR